MSDHPVGDERDGAPGPLEEWIEDVAASKGLSKEEVRNQMMSSYWILSELTGLMADSGVQSPEGDDAGDEEPPDVHPSESGAHRELDETTGTDEDIADLIELAQALNGPSDGTAQPSQASAHNRETGSDRVESELDRIHETVSQLQTRVDRLVDQDISGRNRATDQGGDPNVATKSELEDVTADVDVLDDDLTELRERVEQERGRVDENFGHVEEVLEYLVDQVDVFDEQIDDALDRVTQLETGPADSDPLIRIKETAITDGVSVAACAACDEQIDVALLERPVCPNCSEPFGGLQTTDRWLGLVTDAELVTRSAAATPSHGGQAGNRHPDSVNERSQGSVPDASTDIEDVADIDAVDSGLGADDGPGDLGFEWSEEDS